MESITKKYLMVFVLVSVFHVVQGASSRLTAPARAVHVSIDNLDDSPLDFEKYLSFMNDDNDDFVTSFVAPEGKNPEGEIYVSGQLQGIFAGYLARQLDESAQDVLGNPGKLLLEQQRFNQQHDPRQCNFMNISSSSVDFDCVRYDSRSGSEGGNVTQDQAVFSSENFNDQIVVIKKKKNKKKKVGDEQIRELSATSVAELAPSPEMMRYAAQELIKENQRRQAAEKKEIERAALLAVQEAQRAKQEMQRQRQLELNQKKKVLVAQEEKRRKEVAALEAAALQAALERKLKAKKEMDKVAAARYQQRKIAAADKDKSSMFLSEDDLRMSKFSVADTKIVADAFNAEKNFVLDVNLRSDQDYFHADKNFLIEAFDVVLQRVIANNVLFDNGRNQVVFSDTLLPFVFGLFDQYMAASTKKSTNQATYNKLDEAYRLQLNYINKLKSLGLSVIIAQKDLLNIKKIMDLMHVNNA